MLGRHDDLPGYDEAAALVHNGCNRAFFDPGRGIYHGENSTDYRQMPAVLELTFGLVPDEMREHVLSGLVADIRARGDHLNTGVLGTEYLFPLLTRHGLVGLALTAATQRTYPRLRPLAGAGRDRAVRGVARRRPIPQPPFHG